MAYIPTNDADKLDYLIAVILFLTGLLIYAIISNQSNKK